MADSGTAITKIINYGSLGFGVLAAAAPRTFLGTYGLEVGPTSTVLARIWGTRNIALAVLDLTGDTAATRRRLHQIGVALNAADTVLIASSADLPVSLRARGAITTAFFGILTAVQLSRD